MNLSVKNSNSLKSDNSLKKTVKDEPYIRNNIPITYENENLNNKINNDSNIYRNNYNENKNDLCHFDKNYSHKDEDNNVNKITGVKEVKDILFRKSVETTLNSFQTRNTQKNETIPENDEFLKTEVIFPNPDNLYFTINYNNSD